MCVSYSIRCIKCIYICYYITNTNTHLYIMCTDTSIKPILLYNVRNVNFLPEKSTCQR